MMRKKINEFKETRKLKRSCGYPCAPSAPMDTSGVRPIDFSLYALLFIDKISKQTETMPPEMWRIEFGIFWNDKRVKTRVC